MSAQTKKQDSVFVVIPAFNEAQRIRSIAEQTLAQCPKLIVVDDGSTDDTAKKLDGLAVDIIQLPANQGKAFALWQGMIRACHLGAEAVISLDADGQHRPEDIPRFIQAWKNQPKRLIIGSRFADISQVPKDRLFANKFANFWISWAAGQKIFDSQCGYRLYPAKLISKLKLNTSRGRSFVFESEVIISAAKLGYQITPVPIAAIYDSNSRPSHFHARRDITKITQMLLWSLFSRAMYPQGFYRAFLKKDQN